MSQSRLTAVLLLTLGCLALGSAGCSAPPPEPTAPPKLDTGKAVAALEALGGELARADRGKGPVIKAHLENKKIDDAALANLDGLPDLKWLYLSTGITDAGLAQVALIPELERLYLGGSKVTDDGLRHLVGLTKLEVLDLSDTAITDAGLAHLTGLTKLKNVVLERTKVTDAGLVHLQGLERLFQLNLLSTKVTPKGADALRKTMKNTTVLR